MLRSYEVVFIFTVNQEEFATASQAVRDRLSESKIQITHEEDMGEKSLAYAIDKQMIGHYYQFDLQIDPEQVVQIRETLRYIDGVLRYLLVFKDRRKQKHLEEQRRMRRAAPRSDEDTDDIQTTEKITTDG